VTFSLPNRHDETVIPAARDVETDADVSLGIDETTWGMTAGS
jgi:hypothetical protein